MTHKQYILISQTVYKKVQCNCLPCAHKPLGDLLQTLGWPHDWPWETELEKWCSAGSPEFPAVLGALGHEQCCADTACAHTTPPHSS